ncbi:MAG: DUF421 domain-containing protein [Oscillospiraceae bacterium]|nr:DUF421 domain-containing protein [Oscillospiraceae bacterium]
MISVILRTTVMFILVMFSLRMMGKKNLGEFQPSDLVSTMLISNLTSIVIEAPELPVLYSIVPIILIMSYEVFTSVAVRKSENIARISQGKSMVLVNNGIIDQKVMSDLRFTVKDVLEAMRSKDIFYLEEVKIAIVETTGAVNIYPDPNAQSNIKKATIPPFDVISDGKLKTENLKITGITEEKISKILTKEKTELSNVLLMLADGDGQYNITLKDS